MTKTLLTSLLLLGAGATTAWATPFTGAGSPGALAVVNTGAFGAGATPVLGTAAATTTQLTLVGSDDASGTGCTGGVYEVAGPCRTSAAYQQRGVYAFNWAYSTADISAGGDSFGVLVDGVAIPVYGDPGGPLLASGSARFAAFTSFGWYINCTDCTGGAATARVSNLDLPEPAPWALVFLAGGLAGIARRSAQQRQAFAVA